MKKKRIGNFTFKKLVALWMLLSDKFSERWRSINGMLARKDDVVLSIRL